MLTMTYDIAMAVGMDAGDCHMRKHGRTVWNEEDRNIAAKATAGLLDEIVLDKRGNQV